MQSSTRQLMVMAGFDPVTERRLKDWEARLERIGRPGQQPKDVPHHISLGMYPPSMEEQVRAMVMKAARETAPFPVRFRHLGLFSGGRVLFVAPCVSHALLNLKERFSSGEDWTAHTTMLIDEPEYILPAVGPALDLFEEFDGRMERLFLHEFFPNRFILNRPLSGGD